MQRAFLIAARDLCSSEHTSACLLEACKPKLPPWLCVLPATAGLLAVLNATACNRVSMHFMLLGSPDGFSLSGTLSAAEQRKKDKKDKNAPPPDPAAVEVLKAQAAAKCAEQFKPQAKIPVYESQAALPGNDLAQNICSLVHCMMDPYSKFPFHSQRHTQDLVQKHGSTREPALLIHQHFRAPAGVLRPCQRCKNPWWGHMQVQKRESMCENVFLMHQHSSCTTAFLCSRIVGSVGSCA
eukprot:scaffold289634_cov19-Tisochrysis_lutea.AAC.1